MSLEDLRKRIYRQKEVGAPSEQVAKPWLMKKPTGQSVAVRPLQSANIKKNKNKKYFIFISIASLVVVVATLVTFLIYLKTRPHFDQTTIGLSIETVSQATSGDEILYRVFYSNSSQIKLKNLEMTFYFPPGSLVLEGKTIQNITLPDLAPSQSSNAEFKGILIGNKGDKKEARVTLSFQPENISSRLQKEAKATIEIFHQPLILDLELPERISNNQPFNFSLECLNTSAVAFADLAIKLLAPAQLTILSSQPPADVAQGNFWPINTLAGNSRFKINFQAQAAAEEGEMLTFKAQVGRWTGGNLEVYNEILEKTQLTKPALFVSQTVNNVKEAIASPGETLNFKIVYQNTTDIAIPQVVVQAKLDGELFDFNSLSAPDGILDRAGQTITWNWRERDELLLLNGSQQGEIEFSIRLKADLPIRDFSDQNFQVSSLVSANSEKVPFDLANLPIRGEAEARAKIRTKMTLQAKAYFRDSPIANTGPVPPKVNEETTYTIIWQLMNLNNDVENVAVRAKLPGHVSWENKTTPAEENLIYNSLTGEVVWQIDKLLANTGLLRPVRQVAFQVSITPSDNQVGQTLTLIGQSRATGFDSFCQEDVSADDDAINTSLPDDFVGQLEKGVVIE